MNHFDTKFNEVKAKALRIVTEMEQQFIESVVADGVMTRDEAEETVRESNGPIVANLLSTIEHWRAEFRPRFDDEFRPGVLN